MQQMINVHLKGHDASIGAVLVDVVHGPLQCHRLLGEVLQVLGALLGLLMGLAHLRRAKATISSAHLL